MKTTIFAALAGLTLAAAGPAFAKAAPAENAGNYPMCSAKITDHCMQRSAATHAVKNRHTATRAKMHREKAVAHRKEGKAEQKAKS